MISQSHICHGCLRPMTANPVRPISRLRDRKLRCPLCLAKAKVISAEKSLDMKRKAVARLEQAREREEGIARAMRKVMERVAP